MTRINIIPPKELSDLHLRAELREMPRIKTYIKRSLIKHKNNLYQLLLDVPKNYTLGTGHVKFFYNKLEYLWNRYIQLQIEHIHRFGKQYGSDGLVLPITDLPKELFKQWHPNPDDQYINRKRIYDRIIHSKDFHYTTLKRR